MSRKVQTIRLNSEELKFLKLKLEESGLSQQEFLENSILNFGIQSWQHNNLKDFLKENLNLIFEKLKLLNKVTKKILKGEPESFVEIELNNSVSIEDEIDKLTKILNGLSFKTKISEMPITKIKNLKNDIRIHPIVFRLDEVNYDKFIKNKTCLNISKRELLLKAINHNEVDTYDRFTITELIKLLSNLGRSQSDLYFLNEIIEGKDKNRINRLLNEKIPTLKESISNFIKLLESKNVILLRK